MQVFAKICKITSIELSRSDVRTGVVIDALGDPLSLSRDVASGSPGDYTDPPIQHIQTRTKIVPRPLS